MKAPSVFCVTVLCVLGIATSASAQEKPDEPTVMDFDNDVLVASLNDALDGYELNEMASAVVVGAATPTDQGEFAKTLAIQAWAAQSERTNRARQLFTDATAYGDELQSATSTWKGRHMSLLRDARNASQKCRDNNAACREATTCSLLAAEIERYLAAVDDLRKGHDDTLALAASMLATLDALKDELHQSIALAALRNELGASFVTLSAKSQNYKADLEKLSKELDDHAKNVAKLRTAVDELTPSYGGQVLTSAL